MNRVTPSSTAPAKTFLTHKEVNVQSQYPCSSLDLEITHQNCDDNISDESLSDAKVSNHLPRAEFIKYATSMEHGRHSLIDIISQNPASLNILADEYLRWINQGVDQSEMFSLSYGKHQTNSAQKKTDRHEHPKEFGTRLASLFWHIKTRTSANNIERVPEYYLQLINIHFLPIFLQRVATRVIEDNMVSQFNKSKIKLQLDNMLDSRQVIINNNLNMVGYIANKYAPNRIAFPDLMQEGSIGLIKAVDRFDYHRPVQFSTYAVYWIRQMISRAIIKQKKLVSLPFNLATKISTVFASLNTSLQLNNKKPTMAELAASCHLNIQEIESIMEFYRPCISLFSPVYNEEDSQTMLETLEQKVSPSPLTEVTSNKLNSLLKNAINCLTDKEAYVIRTRFGINNGIELTLQDIADQFHVSKERIRQIQNNALIKLREKYGADLYDFLV